MRDDRDIRLARAAGKKHGVVGVGDVRSAGLDREAVRRAVRRGQLHRMFPGTWSVGHRPLTREAWWMAAILSVGGDAKLCGASACQLYEVHERRVGLIHVLTGNRARSKGRLKVHRGTAPRRTRKGIPVVPIEEALLGLAADPTITDHDVRRALRQAQVDKLTTHARILAHARKRPGATRVRRLLGAKPSPTASELEDAAVELVRRYGFEPEINVVVDGRKADMVIDGVIVELDSEEFHDNSVTALDDARKHLDWRQRGRTTQSWTWDDVHVTPVRTIRRLHAAVASAA